MSFTTHHTFGLRTHFTAQLAQTTRLLQLSTAELAALIESELAQNPALELTTAGQCDSCGRRLRTLVCPICDRRPASAAELCVFLSPRSTYVGNVDFTADRELRSSETLTDFVCRQVAPGLSEADRPVADYLLGNLDERGFLLETPENCAEFLGVALERVRHVLQLIQHADPIGVGARDVRECLLIQLKSLESAEGDRVLVETLIADHWEQLSQRQIRPLAQQLRVAAAEIEAALDFMRRNLTPYPAHTDWHTRRGQPMDITYFAPDAIIHAPNDRTASLSIELLSPVAGWLRVNEAFKAALDDGALSDRAQLIDCVDRAELLVRGLAYRTTTLQRVLEALVHRQSAYFMGTDHALQPMTRAQLARQLHVHESTISRAVTNKLIVLPNGRSVPLDQFFDHSLAARQALKAIIAAEERPFTDDELVQQLAQHGHVVARRTIAKYRDIEHIPSASERGNLTNLARFKVASQ